MDTRVALLKNFYSTMQTNKLKLELMSHGFPFLDKLISEGITLEYGELATNLVHKYRLLNVPQHRMNQLLQGHVNKIHNICLYFNELANNTFCFNLDNNCKINNMALIPEMKPTVTLLKQHLQKYAIEPLVIESGRGYHLWCRLDQAVDNQQLFDFLLRISAKAMASLSEHGYDYNRVKFNIYPHPKTINIASLRLFGSEHVKKKVFSYVHLDHCVLDEVQSWEYFSQYLTSKTISKHQFLEAHADLLATIPPGN
ncbi:hypothetical protein Ga0466249_001575 [Sporomusaceae bacterium BoRhaA]|uniref:hypothetical protein n=1 Tax=Pelorhabdus rhamnosifermentans TaxID=2772457 RepID=UPI001C061825|nr:hypothetical protein [Pelorhabdus rhamnosifermentans]MBU2700483.1 hypothetical protein [Pelorhabdus rhamnosifermentans]